jgi:hypothetical protein
MKTYRAILEGAPSKKAIKKAEADAKEWSKDSENSMGVAWVILQKGKLLVTANGNENGKIISKWADGYKEVAGIQMRYST